MIKLLLGSPCLLPVLFCCSIVPALIASEFAPRQATSLNGEWEFQAEGNPADQWKTVTVPASFQAHEGTNFHGVGWYRKTIGSINKPAGKRVLLHFQAAATEAEVWCDGEKLGTHLGGWTPFRIDITDLLRKPSASHEFRIRLDEKVGHNTQGFLPVIAPHFGGLWQDVELLTVPDPYLDDLSLMAVGDPASRELRVEVPVCGGPADTVTNLALRCRLRGTTEWAALQPRIQRSGDTLQLRAPVSEPRLWSPAEPILYELELGLPGEGGDRIVARAAFRSIEAFGQELRLNGKPLQIRGLLNWGYSAPMVEPNLGEARWRSELEYAHSCGFNLMKFCLWLPPHRYLELADEMGVLTWMEYPTWHPKLTHEFLEPLHREFHEFFQYDRNHPSVVLRSLTCETGLSAELRVIQSLCEAAHQMIPGALVEDDSSWIGWNRVHDFYDDHPYGNNHTWVKTLDGFKEYILGHGLKPLVLGESISADTWIDRQSLVDRWGSERPWWAPTVLDDMAEWSARMRGIAGPGGLEQLRPDSLRYGMLMRKYQVETFRREIPYGGYVITVLRDIPNCSMGLLDYLDRPKWTEAEWAWHRDTICLLKTESDRRSFASGERLTGAILLSHFGLDPIEGGQLEVRLEDPTQSGKPLQILEQKDVQQNPGTLAQLAELNWPLPAVGQPTPVVLKAELKSPQGQFRNEWPLWVVPANLPQLTNVQVHASVDKNLARELFPGCPLLGVPAPGSTVVASHFDDDLARWLESGGRVLFLPDGQRPGLPRAAHWFLRGAPYIPDHALSNRVPRDLLLELQHFDLATDVVPNLPYLDSFDPILLLWDTHGENRVKTHGVIFETRVTKGRLLVSAARHNGATNAAGRWLLSVLLDHLRSSTPPRHTLPDDAWNDLEGP